MAIDVRWIYKAFLGLCMGLVFQFTSSPSVAIDFIESPTLQRLVESGELPAVENRLPTNPMMIQPVTEMGEYGGTWRMGMRRGRDHALLIRTMGYENLLRWNSEWTGVEENIAQIYSVDETSTSYRFVLREGMKWSDGDPFDTEDIRFWYEDVALNPALAEGVAIWRFSGGKVPSLEIHGPYEFSFKFEQPHALFSQFLAAPEGAEPTSYPSHYLKQFLPKYNPEVDQQAQAAGFGNWVEQFHAKFGVPGTIDDKSRWSNPELPTLNAWILDSKFGVDEPLHAKRNPYYWKIDPAGKQLPYIENLVYQVVKSKGDIRGLAAEDTIDMQLRAMASFAEKVNDKPADWAQYRTFGAIDTDMNKSVIALNLTHRDPVLREIFNKRDFRIALSVAIDRASIIRGASENIGIPFQAAPRPESPFYD
ncbi:MAG: ABC transporter substrate-binding protein, partial [Alphaproteobacteria bacterium]|nr:ABC transporter substrate-binding protein [Alphaproteobacteria bacterium]